MMYLNMIVPLKNEYTWFICILVTGAYVFVTEYAHTNSVVHVQADIHCLRCPVFIRDLETIFIAGLFPTSFSSMRVCVKQISTKNIVYCGLNL